MDRAADVRHLDDAHCADLALGLVSEHERREAIEHASRCPACEARLRAHVAAGERARADARTRLGARLRVVTGGRSVHNVRLAALAAAAALAVAVALPLLQQAPLERDHATRLSIPGEGVRTRGGQGEDPHLTAGLAAYAARDLATAERELSAARAEGGEEQMRRLYLAQVRYDRGRALDALQLLRSIDWRYIPAPWRREGEALLARTLRACGQPHSADSIENALRSSPPGAPFVP